MPVFRTPLLPVLNNPGWPLVKLPQTAKQGIPGKTKRRLRYCEGCPTYPAPITR